MRGFVFFVTFTVSGAIWYGIIYLIGILIGMLIW